MPSIHLLCKKDDHLHRVPAEVDYESGNWDVTAADAKRLIGGMIYLHRSKDRRSYFGGRIKDARLVVTNDRRPLRFVFRFTPLLEAKEVSWEGDDHGMASKSGVVEE